MAFAKLLRNLHARPAASASASCRSSPTRRARSAWTRCSRRSASTPRWASATSRSTRTWCSRIARRRTARCSRRASPRPARRPRFQAAGTSYATHAEPMIPFYIFYSMFGFQRTGDEFWAFARRPRREASCWARTAGRTTLNGEGLQHEDGHTLRPRLDIPSIRAYDPAFAYETRGHHPRRHRAGCTAQSRRMSSTTSRCTTRTTSCRRGRRASPTRTSCAACTGSGRHRKVVDGRALAGHRCCSGGSIMQQALRAQEILAERFGVAADVWSATVVPAAPQRGARGRALEPAPPG